MICKGQAASAPVKDIRAESYFIAVLFNTSTLLFDFRALPGRHLNYGRICKGTNVCKFRTAMKASTLRASFIISFGS